MSGNVGHNSESIAINDTNTNGTSHTYNKTNDSQTTTCEEDQAPQCNPNDTRFSFSKVPRRKKAVLILCTVQNFLSACAISVLGPFYPVEAERKGMSLTVIGLVFSVYQLIVFLASPIIGNFMTRIGVKFVYLSGVFVGGCCTILFGLLDKGPGGDVFVVTSLLVRSVEALGFAGFMTASMTIVYNEFPDYVGSVMALQKTGTGLGFMIGPVMAGFLYELGGYGLPFYTLGVSNLLGGVLIFTFLDDNQDNASKVIGQRSFLPLLRSLMIVFPMVSVFVAAASLNVNISTFAWYMEQFDINGMSFGGIYAIGPLFCFTMTPLAGYITDVKDIQGALIIFGHLLFCIAWLILGPSPLLPFISASILSTVISRFVSGVSFGCLMVPTMKCMMKGALELKYEQNADTCALVSGLFNSAFALGGFIGPIAGGALVESAGFPQGYTLFGLVNLLTCLLAVGFFCFRYVARRKRTKYETLSNIEMDSVM